MTETYDFSAQPKMVRAKIQKYPATEIATQVHDEEFEKRFKYQNLMFEKRVVRGNTYSEYVKSKEDELLYRSNQQTSMRGGGGAAAAAASRNAIDPKLQNSFNQTTLDVDPVENWADQPPQGKAYAKCYVEPSLLAETDLPPSHDATTQTDFIIEKEIPDLSIPKYNPISKETQIYPGELPFDFEYEAEPLIQVLMTRILEESRIEVLEEQELIAMKKRQEYIILHKMEVKRRLDVLEQREKENRRLNVIYMIT